MLDSAWTVHPARSRVIDLYRYIRPLHVRTMHRSLRVARVLLSPEFYESHVDAEGQLGAHGGERAKRAKEVKELRVSVVRGELSDDAGEGRRRRQGCGRVR